MDETQGTPIAETMAVQKPGAWTLLKQGIAFLFNRIDVLLTAVVVQFAFSAYVIWQSPYIEEGVVGQSELLLFAVMAILSTIVAVLHTIALLYISVSDEPELSYMDGMKWALSHIFSYIWVVLILTFVTLAGFILLVIPGIILSLYLTLTMTVFVLEHKRGMNALLRSRALLDGRLLETFLVLLVVTLLAILIGIGVGLVFALIIWALSLLGDLTTTTLIMGVMDIMIDLAAVVVGAVVVKGWYLYVKTATPALEEGAEDKYRKKYTLLGWFGLLALVLIPFVLAVIFATAGV